MKMKRLSRFNTLESELLDLDNEEALSLIQAEDNRLGPQHVTLFTEDDYCSFGGIYQEVNSTADENMLFAVEFYSYSIYNKEIDNDMTYVGVIATNIEYRDENGKRIKPRLGQYHYAEIYNSDKRSIDLIQSLKDNVTVRGLSLKYIASTFEEAAQKLNIID